MAVALSISAFGAESVNYDALRQGQLPPGWSAPVDREWEVRADKTAPSHPNVLQVEPGAGVATAPLALFDKVVCRDGDLSVKFRIAAGPAGSRRGNAAGIVWRYRDPGNYYLLSLSAEDGNVVLYRIQNGVTEVVSPANGKRAGQGVSEDIRAGQWHVVKVAFRGPRVQVFFGNRVLFTAEDSGISAAGKTGVWAKGPNGAAYDDFRIDKKG